MDFPIVTASLSDEPRGSRGRVYPSRRAEFVSAVALVEQHLAAQAIPNPVFQEIKNTINRALETAWDVIRERHIYSGRYRDLPDGVNAYFHTLSTPALHIIPGLLKRADKPIAHPLRDEVVALVRELLPLAEAFTKLKDLIVKRQIKPVEERVEGYEPPPVSTEGEKQVVALLERVTQASYDSLKAVLLKRSYNLLDRYLTAQRAAVGHLSPHQFFMPRGAKVGQPDAWRLIAQVVENKHGLRYEQKPDLAAIFEREATKTADEYRMAFVHKNFRKIASIIDAKGNFASSEVVSHTVDITGMSGSLAFHFKDGASFKVQNNVVYVINHYGTRFLRFPLTFHNVVLPNGKAMQKPSQERMNTLFAARS